MGPLAGAIATGLALVLAAPPWGVSILAWVAFWPLLRALPAITLARRVWLGSVAGMVWSVGTVGPWLLPAIRAHVVAGTASAAALTLIAAWMWGGVYLALLAAIYPRLPRPGWASMPAAWVLGEAARSHFLDGVPWSLLGHSQHDVFLVRQLAELTGVAGLSFLIAMPSAALAGPPSERRTGLIVAAGLLVAIIGFGASRSIEVAAPGMPRRVRMLSGLNGTADAVAQYAAAMRATAADLTIWPEGATPGYLQEEASVRATLASAATASGWLLTGARRFEGGGAARRYFNSAMLINPRGELVGGTDKQHLVPLAEANVLGIQTTARPFTAATTAPTLLAAGRFRVGALVCWDALFPDVSRTLVAEGADLLANLSSDVDLDRALPQLLAGSRFRAIETRRWLVRASGVGSSLAIDPFGRIIPTTDLALGSPSDQPLTFYVRHGETVPWIAATLLILLWARPHRERTDAPPPRTNGRG